MVVYEYKRVSANYVTMNDATLDGYGALGWELVSVQDDIMYFKKISDDENSDYGELKRIRTAVEAQSGAASLLSFSQALTTSWVTLPSKAGSRLIIQNTDLTRTLRYRAAGSTDDGTPILPASASIQIPVANANLMQVKCDLLTATAYCLMLG